MGPVRPKLESWVRKPSIRVRATDYGPQELPMLIASREANRTRKEIEANMQSSPDSRGADYPGTGLRIVSWVNAGWKLERRALRSVGPPAVEAISE